MLLHHLDMTAFGPFAGTVSVDFEALSDAGVFLLCGDTGAGKTTVLDGVCFALYGDVPGARAAARQLRSHHAAAGVAPRVVLELSIAGRRFRFTRSPAWRRPKKRGNGSTTEQARVLVEERDGGGWLLRSNRLDEAGHLVGELLGMTLSQFSQVVLLPQGQFDTFLRSSSEDRQKVLTQLFQTGRFEQVERWLAERRKELWRDQKRHSAMVAGVAHRLSEAGGEAAPGDWDAEDLTVPATTGALRAWADDLLAAAAARRAAAAKTAAQAALVRSKAESVLGRAREVAELHNRRQRALMQQAALAGEAEAAEKASRRLLQARRAAPVVPLLRVAEDAAGVLAEAEAQARAALLALAEALDEDPEVLRSENLAGREEQTGAQLAAARAFLPRAEELRLAEERREEALSRSEQLVSSLTKTREQLARLPAQRTALQHDLAETRARAGRLTAGEVACAQAEVRLEAARTVRALTPELEASRAAEAAEAAAAQALRERWLDVRERRLDGMAAELAAAMVVGAECPVCGSADHPSPARPAPDAPGRTDEQQALKDSEDAQLALEAHRDRVRGLITRLEAARQQAGDNSLTALTDELTRLRNEVERCRAAQDRVTTLEHELADLDRLTTDATSRVASIEAELAATRDRTDELTATVQRLSAELAALLAGEDRLEDVIAGHQRLRDLVARARQALAEEERCARHAGEAASRAAEAATAVGFDDGAAALDAHLASEELAALECAVRDREHRQHQVAVVLADPDVDAAAAQPPPDLERLRLTLEAAEQAHTVAVSELRLVDGAAARLLQLSDELDRVLKAWAPAREEYTRVRSLAELVEGKSVENTRQMRLSAYVLASRLSLVVASANERLARMVDGRYALEHSDTRAVGDRRGGLSLAVRDQWTDERRDPVTLSGGETFVVSLSLALGLADVVTAESGGVRIDTLFVDEGFGSLDADTLEQVMDTLDQLREGGRAVGVVSHVADMRDRIPTQLRVLKGRNGSHLEQTG